MKNFLSNQLPVLAILLCLTWNWTSAVCSLPQPENLIISAWSSCDVTLQWNAVPGASFYKVKYKLKNDAAWTIVNAQLTELTYTFTNLIADSTYKLAVAAFCSVNQNSGYQILSRKLRPVTKPSSLHASEARGSSLKLSWNSKCPTPFFELAYKASTSSAWNLVSNIIGTTKIVSGLNPSTNYDFKVRARNGGDSTGWTTPITTNSGIQSHSKPNILLFLLDDGRYDQFQPNGGPAWFNTPAITRIANEGVNFVYTFPTTSQCGPSRMSIYSGLYANHHGLVNNETAPFDGIPLVQQMLHDAGYYTGFVGKYGQKQGRPEGFDWWATTAANAYINPKYTINGRDTAINGHISDVYQNLAMTFLNQVPQGKSFCLMFFTRVPHGPTTPQSQELTLFTQETMPFPDNFYEYSFNYPSYFYSSGHTWENTEEQTDSVKLQDFQCLYGAEHNMSAFLEFLTSRNILDSTIIIVTSDNGFLEGEHLMHGKQVALEESIRVPLFIRYPAWFTPGERDSITLANNIDIAPTLLAAANIPDTFNMDGVSLRQLHEKTLQRKYFYYQFAAENATPSIRAVRSSRYKYVKAYCNQLTEEFYDLYSDPKENTNQINNSDYSNLISSYKNILDSMMTAIGDTAPTTIDCYLVNPQYLRSENEEESENNLRNLEVYPNPSSDFCILHFVDVNRGDIKISITNELGQQVYYKMLMPSNVINITLNISAWSKGFYLISVEKNDGIFTSKLIVE